jgi:hypothetical protein
MQRHLQSRTTKIALFNDTGNRSHVGCLAVSDAHNRMLAHEKMEVLYRFFVTQCRECWRGNVHDSVVYVLKSPLARKIASVDAVVVNGEGTIHHTGGRHLLTILTVAQELGVATFLVNAVLQASETHLETLRRLQDFTVRDLYSSRYLDGLNIPHRLVMDSILEAQFSSRPRHDFSGKIVITDFHRSRTRDVGSLMRQMTKELGHEAVYYPLQNRARIEDWRHAVADMSTAKTVITARHHGVYVAGLAGVPFVALGSNTWKVEGLLAMFGENLRICTELSELREKCRTADQNHNLFTEFHHFLKRQKPLSTFARLVDHFNVSSHQ